ncbi:MAG TPA: hypothetical protein VEU33_24885 [Archangium sp.]|nr:hypothetical protein [Archangium sp.]
MSEVVVVSLVGMVVFGGLFVLLCPEWWSNSLGTLKDKQKHAETKAPEADNPAAPRQAGKQ